MPTRITDLFIFLGGILLFPFSWPLFTCSETNSLLKKVRVSGQGVLVDVLISWENILTEDYPDLHLKKGQDLSIHYRNNKDMYKYEPLVYYDRPYSPSEKLLYLQKKNPLLDVLIKQFELVLSV